jgi:hypothetical protein
MVLLHSLDALGPALGLVRTTKQGRRESKRTLRKKAPSTSGINQCPDVAVSNPISAVRAYSKPLKTRCTGKKRPNA